MLKLIVGIGNPGLQYEQTRHNAGFWFIDALVKQYQLNLRLEKKFALIAADLNSEGQRITIAKTTSFMNHSGQAIGACAKFFQLAPQEILVVHDELDLAPGTVRLKFGGGHGGHNGLRDIISHLNGATDFYRLRIGIGHPGNKDLVHDYVLHRPGNSDQIEIDHGIERALDLLPTLLANDENKFMNELHQS